MKGLAFIAILVSIVNFAWAQKVNIPTNTPPVISSPTNIPKQLPIFKLSRPLVNESTVQQIAQNTFGKVGKIAFVNNKYVTETDNQLVEVDLNGNVWAADRNQLWNPQLDVILPADAVALNSSVGYLNAQGLLKKQANITTRFSHYGGTQAAILEKKTGKRVNKKLDTQVIYNSYVDANPTYAAPELPIVDGMGEITVTFGNNNRIIGFNSSLCSITGVAQVGTIISQADVENQFIKSNSKLAISDVKSFLGYAAISSNGSRDFLYPVYVIGSNILVNGVKVPQRLVTVPATSFSLLNYVTPKLSYRDGKTLPTRISTLKEGLEEAGNKINFKSPLNYNFNQNTSLSHSFECATSWIGASQNLGGSAANATGFVNRLSGNGWAVNFNWGEENCWESDWRRDAGTWVDAADFVFYTGHAAPDGWAFNAPDDGWMHNSEVNASTMLWGKNDLEWMVIAACGPLQDNLIVPNGGDAFGRWQGAFKGLHQLLGYGAATFDNEREGNLLAQYCLEGHTIIDAWLRTAREVQPSTNPYSAPMGPKIWVGAMYGYSSSETNPLLDHIWGRGSVAPDSPNSEFLVIIWTPT